jgi:phosphatidylglycerol:prolipoprotein diacylglycerol transferase
MCQTLFFIPLKFAGYPVFGLGLLLILWVVASIGMLAWLAWRQGWIADTWGYVPILLLLGAIIYWVLPVLCEPQGLPIRGYGVMIMLGVIAGTSLAAWQGKRLGLDPDIIVSMVFWMLVPGIIGARAFYVIEYWPEYARAYTDPGGGFGSLLGGIVNISKGGLVVYGSFFGGVAGLLVFVRRHRLPLLAMGDLLAPGMVLGLAIGRIGCLMNGCCFGAVCDYPWALQFPADSPPYYAQVERGQMYGFTLSSHPKAEPRVLAVKPDSPADKAGLKTGDLLLRIDGEQVSSMEQAFMLLSQTFHQEQPLRILVQGRPEVTIPAIEPLPERSLPVHPTQIYSTIEGFFLCLLLLIASRYRRRDGEVFALLITIYPVTRFFIETLRTDEATISGTGMSISQNVSLLLLICAAGLWFYILQKPRGTARFQ